MLIRSPYNYDRDEASLETGIVFLDPSLTQQHQAVDADINVIVNRYMKSGTLPVVNNLPTYGDFSGVSDYREALELVRDAEKQFMSLPAAARAAFDHNPANLLDFLSVERTSQELSDIGLREPDIIPTPTPE